MRSRVCPNCLLPLGQDVAVNRVYCNDACKQQAHRKRHRVERAKSDNLRKAFCRNCGTRFETARANKIFCKDSCRVSFWQQEKRFKEREGK